MTAYTVSHQTTLHYDGVVRLAQFILRLHPGEWPGQHISDFKLSVTPSPSQIRHSLGPFGLRETRIALREPTAKLSIHSSFHVEAAAGLDLSATTSPTLADIREMALTTPDLSPQAPANYLFASPIARPVAEIGAWAAEYLSPESPILEAGHALMMALHAYFDFDAAATRPDMPPAEAFAQKRGVCQDFSHVMIVAARAHGLPAAYVSGYLRTIPPPGKPRLVGADAMHAWVALWCGPGLGWVGFDPTNAKLAGSDHIIIGMGRDYSDVAPLDGVFHGGAGQTMTVAVDVVPDDTASSSEAIGNAPRSG